MTARRDPLCVADRIEQPLALVLVYPGDDGLEKMNSIVGSVPT